MDKKSKYLEDYLIKQELCNAVTSNNMKLVNKILSSGIPHISVETKNLYNQTLILIASQECHINMINWLHEKWGGADLYKKDEDDNNIFVSALNNGKTDGRVFNTLMALLKLGVDPFDDKIFDPQIIQRGIMGMSFNEFQEFITSTKAMNKYYKQKIINYDFNNGDSVFHGITRVGLPCKVYDWVLNFLIPYKENLTNINEITQLKKLINRSTKNGMSPRDMAINAKNINFIKSLNKFEYKLLQQILDNRVLNNNLENNKIKIKSKSKF